MGAGAGEGQDKDVVFDSIEKKLIGSDMAVARSFHVAREGVVMVLRGEWFARRKDVDNSFKLGDICAALNHLLEFLGTSWCV